MSALRAALVAHGRTFPARLDRISGWPLAAWRPAYREWEADLKAHRERVRAYWQSRK